MSIDIQMPALSPTMEKGTLARWLVAEGDVIKAGDLIAEIETDKATMEVEATDDGRVGRLVIGAGTEDVPVGEVIAILMEEGEEAPSAPEAPSAAKADTPPPPPVSKDKPVTEKKAARSEPETVKPASSGGDVIASPLARRIAEQSEIDLSGIKGSGPGGRIIKRDLEGKAKLRSAEAPVSVAQAPAPAAIYEPPQGVPVEEVRLSGMRKVIASRMVESKSTVPHFYISVDVTLDKLLALRKQINESEGTKISVNDFFIRALGLALTRVPEANVQFGGDKLYKFSRADVSVAVAIEGGLITPVIRDAGSKGLGAISAEMKDLAVRARDGKLAPEDYQGGTASLSNLGMYGIRQFDAVINPPQAAILAVGAGEERAVVRDGAVAVATQMTATLSCDHRAIDGAIGAEMLGVFKALVEDPLKILI
jgi:pyruvate dehydrogenase E2 component (dihydrolipoamide acetyltransferase)